MTSQGGIARGIKRIVDVTAALLGLTVLFPLLAMASLLIVCESGFPILFRQERVGKDAAHFWVLKFRTMLVGAEKMGAKYGFEKDDPRITRVGRLLRLTSLDELPQLLNVLKGDMSLIGPRPALPYQVVRYTPEQKRRLTVKPGMTGLAVIRGRNSIPWSERIMIDLEYIDRWSLALDFSIMLQTVIVVVLRRGLQMDQAAEEVEDFDSGDQKP